MAVRIIERELALIQSRDASRAELFRHIDYHKLKAFNEVSRGNTYILMSDLIYFLENNGFCPRTDDVEAILRRCDHDAD